MLSYAIRRALLNRYSVFLVALYLYHYFTNPVIELTPGIWRMEVPLLVYLYVVLNAFIKSSRWQPFIAAIPLAVTYAVHDYYFLRFFRIPRLDDVAQIPELLAVAGVGFNLALLALALALLTPLLWQLRLTRRGLWLAIPGLLVLAGPWLYPGLFIQAFSTLSMEVIHYAALINVERNGRIVTALYHEARRRQTRARIDQYRDGERLSLKLAPALEDPSQANGRNIHLILLEGFLDPSLFGNLPGRVNSLHPDFVAHISPDLGLSTSPVFGGYTAQAEFEILCGVPALQEFGEIEYNVFTGATTYCLPEILRRFGYRTLASNGFKPDFFNAMPAYRSLGFDLAQFPREYAHTLETYLTKGDDQDNQYFFDGDMYAQNLAFIKQLQATGRPFFNYLLTVYGHFPFTYDRRMGPPLFPASDLPWDLERILNQTYYRSKALVDYLRDLQALDPESLILVVSDHLPPLTDGVEIYGKFGYLAADTPDRYFRNRLWVYRDGQARRYDPFYHFNIYRLILDYVTQGAYCQSKPCDFRYPLDKEAWRDDYRIIIGLASRH